VLTPHVRASDIAEDPDDQIERRDVALMELRRGEVSCPALHLGFEIMLDQPLPAIATSDRRFSLAWSRYFLVEFPLGVVPDFARTIIEQISHAGVVPVVAHPERYRGCSVESVTQWRQAGARIQVDATTLTRPTGRGHRARELLAHGLVDVLAADNHGDNRVMTTGVEYLAKRGARAIADLLTKENPKAIIEDREMVEVPPVPVTENWLARMRRFVVG
jgi:protein-tyrosine phosphatase